MEKVDLYIECSSRTFQAAYRVTGYLLEYISTKGVPWKSGDFLEGSGTYNQETLRAIADALGHMKRPCSICIHSQNRYVLNMIQKHLSTWAAAGFSVNGREIKNREEWLGVWQRIEQHEISIKPGKHAYSGLLLEEIQRREREAQ